MSTNNTTSSDLTMKRQTRMQFANYIIQQQALANGCLGRITIDGGSGGDNAASIFTQIKEGQRFTTAAERDLILASSTCPSVTSSSSGGDSGSTPPDPPPVSGGAAWAISLNTSTTQTNAAAQNRASWVDNDGNIYIGGGFNWAPMTINSYVRKTGTTIEQTAFGILPGESPASAVYHSYIIKYNSSGVAQWATSVATSSGSQLYSLVVDSAGNVYSTHYFRGTATVNSYGGGGGAGGTITLTAYGTSAASSSDDVLIVKHNSSGVAQWMAQITGAAAETIGSYSSKDITIDTQNNIIFSIQSSTTTDLTFKSFSSGGGGAATTFSDFGTFAGTNGALYTCKINSSGVFQWVSQVKPTNTSTSATYATSTDIFNNIYLAFTANFPISLQSYVNVSSGAISTTTWGTSAMLGNIDGYVAKLLSTGSFTACARIGGTNRSQNPANLITDGTGENIFAGFRYFTTQTFNASNKTNIYSYDGVDPAGGAIGFTAWASLSTLGTGGGGDTAILKFNSNLTAQAATRLATNTTLGGGNFVLPTSIDRDSDNNVYLNAWFNGNSLQIYDYVSLGAGGLNNNVNLSLFATLSNTGNSSQDAGIIKYNSNLVTQWATRVNDVVTTNNTLPYSISVDRTNGFLYSSGQFTTNNLGGEEFQTYTGVSGGQVTLSNFGTINSAATTTSSIIQAYLVKYKL